MDASTNRGSERVGSVAAHPLPSCGDPGPIDWVATLSEIAAAARRRRDIETAALAEAEASIRTPGHVASRLRLGALQHHPTWLAARRGRRTRRA